MNVCQFYIECGLFFSIPGMTKLSNFDLNEKRDNNKQTFWLFSGRKCMTVNDNMHTTIGFMPPNASSIDEQHYYIFFVNICTLHRPYRKRRREREHRVWRSWQFNGTRNQRRSAHTFRSKDVENISRNKVNSLLCMNIFVISKEVNELLL